MLCYVMSLGSVLKALGWRWTLENVSFSFTPLPSPCFQSGPSLLCDTDFTHRGLEPATREIGRRQTLPITKPNDFSGFGGGESILKAFGTRSV